MRPSVLAVISVFIGGLVGTALRLGLRSQGIIREHNKRQWDSDEAVGWMEFFGPGRDAFRQWLSPQQAFTFLVSLHLEKKHSANASHSR